MSIKNGFYLGKYEEHFFVYTSEGELLGAGKEIQNTCSFLINLLYFSLDDKRVIEDMFQRKGFNSYDKVIMDCELPRPKETWLQLPPLTYKGNG